MSVGFNGDGECSTVAVSLGRFVAQADHADPKVINCPSYSSTFTMWTRCNGSQLEHHNEHCHGLPIIVTVSVGVYVLLKFYCMFAGQVGNWMQETSGAEASESSQSAWEATLGESGAASHADKEGLCSTRKFFCTWFCCIALLSSVRLSWFSG